MRAVVLLRPFFLWLGHQGSFEASVNLPNTQFASNQFMYEAINFLFTMYVIETSPFQWSLLKINCYCSYDRWREKNKNLIPGRRQAPNWPWPCLVAHAPFYQMIFGEITTTVRRWMDWQQSSQAITGAALSTNNADQKKKKKKNWFGCWHMELLHHFDVHSVFITCEKKCLNNRLSV